MFVALAQEKQEEQFRQGIEGFHKDELKHVKTDEKNPLPPPEGQFKVISIDQLCNN